MLKNKKGITIIELIVSISLISMVMMFMYRLLADVTFQKEDDFIATVNQEQRIEIMNTVHKTIGMDRTVSNFIQQDKKIIFYTTHSEYCLEVNNSKIIFKICSEDKPLNEWNIKGGTLSKPTCKTTELTEEYLTECTIKVYTENINNKMLGSIDNNNTLDDLVFSFKYKR